LGVMIKKLEDEPNFDKISEFIINRGIDHLREYDPTAVDQVVDPLRRLLGKRYHQLNSREYSKALDLNDRGTIEHHTKTITSVIQAIASL